MLAGGTARSRAGENHRGCSAELRGRPCDLLRHVHRRPRGDCRSRRNFSRSRTPPGRGRSASGCCACTHQRIVTCGCLTGHSIS